MSQLQGTTRKEVAEKIKALVKSAKICMLSTSVFEWPLQQQSVDKQNVDDEGNIWLYPDSLGDENKFPQHDPKVQLFYSNASKSQFLSLFGTASISDDQQQVIKIMPQEVYYWDERANSMVPMLPRVA